MDNLKKYLQQHLDELDSDIPGDAVWQKIQETSTPVLPKRNVVKIVWQYAAAVCVLVCIAATIFFLDKKQATTNEIAANTTDTNKPAQTIVVTQPADEVPVVKSTTPETKQTIPVKKSLGTNVYARSKQPKQPQISKRTITIDPAQLLVQDVEKNYAQLVNMQLQRLKVTPVYAESPDYFSTFKQQFKQIEADEAAIKKDIRLHGLNDELLQQFININQQKLNVLKDLQAEVNKLNNKVKQAQNRQDSSQSFYLNM